MLQSLGYAASLMLEERQSYPDPEMKATTHVCINLAGPFFASMKHVINSGVGFALAGSTGWRETANRRA